jgi:hypothetical protein
VAGLILLVIVGAWLAVLVPMALHSHDSAASLKSADKFGDAMRVLRRSSRDVLVPRRPAESLVFSETRSSRSPLVVPVVPGIEPTPVLRSGLTVAQRRLRTLVALLGLSWLSLLLAVVAVPGTLWVHIGADVLLIGFAVHLRRQAKAKASRRAAELRRARTAPPAPKPAPKVTGVPERMPVRPAPLAVPEPAPAARYEDKPLAATGTGGAPWSPVPVPPPMYVGKATAPRRIPRVLDLTKPGEWTAALEGEDTGVDWQDQGPELEDIIDRRRSASGW